MMVKAKLGINKKSQNLEGFCAYNKSLTQFGIKTKPVGFFLSGGGNNTCLVETDLHEVRNAAATYCGSNCKKAGQNSDYCWKYIIFFIFKLYSQKSRKIYKSLLSMK
jgi:hypothetical protein